MASREKQIKRLKKDALKLWEDQQALFGRAGGVYTSALPHAQYLAQTKLGPTAAVYAASLRPLVGKGTTAGLAASRAAATSAQDAVFGTVVPAVASAAAAALALASEAGQRLNAQDLAKAVKGAAGSVSKVTKARQASDAKTAAKLATAAKATKAADKAVKSAAKAKSSGVGAGGTVGILLGVVAVAGIGYAVWQTLRADDDLWVADDEPETTPTTDAPTA